MLVLKGSRQPVGLVRFTPDGRSLVAPSYAGLQVWSGLPTPGDPARFGPPCYSRNAAFTPDGTRLFTDERRLTVRDAPDWGAAALLPRATAYGSLFNLTPDGTRVVVSQNNFRGPRGWLTCLPVENPVLKASVWVRRPVRHNTIHPQFIRGGEQFVTTERWREGEPCRTHFRYVVRSTATGEVVSEADGPELPDGGGVVTSPDGLLIAAIRTVRVYVLSVDDFSSGPGQEVTPAATLRNDSRKEFTGVAFHPGGRYLATTSNDATVKFHDTRTWAVAKTFTWAAGKMRSVAFSPDGTLAAAGTDTGRVVVWDVDL